MSRAFLPFILIFVLVCESPPVLSQDSLVPPVPPTEVARGDRLKRCPPDFQHIGKECLKVVRVPSSSSCPSGSELTSESACSQYSGKSMTCPPEFETIGGRCERRATANPTAVCPEGFIFDLAGLCSYESTPPPTEQCPPGSLPVGDTCIMRARQDPEYSCPPGYTSEGKICRIEELYNCTPVRTEIPSGSGFSVPESRSSSAASSISPLAAVPVVAGVGVGTRPRFPGYGAPPSPASSESFRSQAALGMNFASPQRQPELRWRRTQAQAPPSFAQEPTSKDFVPEVTNYVVQATCKRIRTIAAQRLCANGVLSGKMCIVDIEVPKIRTSQQSVPVVFTEEPTKQCPPEFTLESPTVCSLIETANMMFVCPGGTQDIGDRCVTSFPPARSCPPTFVSESDTVCVATLRAPPITEFTVRFACVGKECERQP